jgi:hypothetical protein
VVGDRGLLHAADAGGGCRGIVASCACPSMLEWEQ